MGFSVPTIPCIATKLERALSDEIFLSAVKIAKLSTTPLSLLLVELCTPQLHGLCGGTMHCDIYLAAYWAVALQKAIQADSEVIEHVKGDLLVATGQLCQYIWVQSLAKQSLELARSTHSLLQWCETRGYTQQHNVNFASWLAAPLLSAIQRVIEDLPEMPCQLFQGRDGTASLFPYSRRPEESHTG